MNATPIESCVKRVHFEGAIDGLWFKLIKLDHYHSFCRNLTKFLMIFKQVQNLINTEKM